MVTFAGYLPRPLAAPLAAVLGALAFKIDKKGLKRALWHMEITEVGKDKEDRLRIARAMYRHLALTVLEILWVGKHIDRALDFVTWENMEIADEAFKKGKGVCFITSHQGNWELAGALVGLKFPGTGAIVREQRDEGLDALVSQSRSRAGVTQFPNTKGQGPALAAHLLQNRPLGILLDVYASRRHPPVPFLGVPTPTYVGPADLMRTVGAQAIFIYMERLAPYKHVMRIAPITLEWTQDKEADLLRATTLFNNLISEAIRKKPEQWLWIMKRWRAPEKEAVQPTAEAVAG